MTAPRIRGVVDLSHPLDDDTPVYPGDPVVRVTPATTLDAHGYNVLHVRMGSQSGTHVDAPFHLLADGARIDELPLSCSWLPRCSPTSGAGRRTRPSPGPISPPSPTGWRRDECSCCTPGGTRTGAPTPTSTTRS